MKSYEISDIAVEAVDHIHNAMLRSDGGLDQTERDHLTALLTDELTEMVSINTAEQLSAFETALLEGKILRFTETPVVR